MLVDLMNPESMLEEIECPNTYFAQFCQKYDGDENYAYYFHEGYEDPLYYDSFIKTLLQKTTVSIRCENKKNVIELYNFMKHNLTYDETKYMYFVDKDYSTNDLDRNIYVTPYYSVENFYVSSKVLRDILRINFCIEEQDDITKILELYDSLQKDFNNKLLFFNSWLACQNDFREAGEFTSLNIDKKVEKYFLPNKSDKNDDIVDRSLIKLYRNFEDLNNIEIIENTLFIKSNKIDISKIDAKKQEFLLKDDLYYFFRGKFEFHFLISFLKRLKQYCETNISNLLSKEYTRCSIDLTTKCDDIDLKKNYIMSVLSTHAYKPGCLRTYILSKG